MSILRTIPEDEAEGLVAELYEEDRESLGYVPSHTRVMALNPAAVRAFENLLRAGIRTMDRRRYELVTLAAAAAIGSQACLLAHSKNALAFFEAEQLERVLREYRDAGLSTAEIAMMDFAATMSRDSASMTDADSQRLRNEGFSDEEIIDIAVTAGARNFYSRTLHALAVDVDVPPGLDARIVAAIV